MRYAAETLRRRGFLFAVLVLLIAGSTARGQDAPRTPEPPTQIEVKAIPITAFEPRDPARRRFGELEFRGGLQLTSPYKDFGGISAIRVAPDGRFLALTDKARWLRGRITYDGTRPLGIADAEMAPMLGPDGKTLRTHGWYDTESMTQDGGTLYVGVERANVILRFDYGRHGLIARAQQVAVPNGITQLPNNKGLECVAYVPRGGPLGGTLMAVSEQGLDQAGNIQAFLLGGPTPGVFTVKRSDDFDVSDCALLSSAEFLVLERRYSPMRGVAMRIRRIPMASIKPGALVDGPIVIEADMGYQVDNMEGLSVHRTPAGDVVLTIISDDNFSPIQRTILLQFTLVE